MYSIDPTRRRRAASAFVVAAGLGLILAGTSPSAALAAEDALANAPASAEVVVEDVLAEDGTDDAIVSDPQGSVAEALVEDAPVAAEDSSTSVVVDETTREDGATVPAEQTPADGADEEPADEEQPAPEEQPAVDPSTDEEQPADEPTATEDVATAGDQTADDQTAREGAAANDAAAEGASEQVVISKGWHQSETGGYYFVDELGARARANSWIVDDSYLDYGLQRYWIDSNGELAGEGLYQTGDNTWTYVRPERYVVRGKYQLSGLTYLANNDGLLEKTGWIVTNAYDNGVAQRYWIDEDKHAAVEGYSSDGWDHYTTSSGYVQRGVYNEGGVKRWADNDGRLATSRWLVTTDFGQGLQRYWMQDDGSAATGRYISAGEAGFAAYATSDGYVARGRVVEGAKMHIADNDGKLIGSGIKGSAWLVTSDYSDSIQRYWVTGFDGVDGGYVTLGYSPDGYAHYTTDKGYVARGAVTVGSKIYLADNNGKLANAGNAKDSWVVSNEYGHGLQRYYVAGHNGTDGGYATEGFSTAGGWAHYTTGNGYVVRGAVTDGDVKRYANNEGVISYSCWVVTSAFGDGLQRYWFDSKGAMAADRLVTPSEGAGYYAYATSSGYVVRGSWDTGRGLVYLADNNGKLAEAAGDGWLVTSAYAGSIQRYYIDPTSHAARSGFFTVGSSSYFGQANVGYVLRGKLSWGSNVLLANNDGIMAATSGWLTTSAYDGSEQRYYLVDVTGAGKFFGAKTGLFSVSGNSYYAFADKGYILRGGVYVVSSYYAAPAGDDYNYWHDDTIVVARDNGVLYSRSEVGQMIVASARTQLGYNYSYVNSGYFPYDSFNCSGLSWWAYNDALGINLSHNQGYWSYYAQQDNRENSQSYGVMKRDGWTTNVDYLVPGDLVFFSPAGSRYSTGHVGIYVGDGMMIDAYPGIGVTRRSVYQSGFVGGGSPITVLC